MKRRFNLLLCLALISALGAAQAMAADSAVKAEHSVTYSAKGTRSEAQHGHLSLNGQVVPDCYSTIIVGNTAYCFCQRTNMWGSDGYWPCLLRPMAMDPGPALTSAEIDQGWRVGAAKPADLPQDWAFAQWPTGSAWAKAEALPELARALNLPEIPRQTMQMMMREKRP